MKVACVDFDGTIYPNMRYRGAGHVSGDPIPGAKEALAELSKEYRIVVHSARCASEEGIEAIRVWLAAQEMPYDVVRDKPHAGVYIDDRAIGFSGDWAATVVQVREFRQWQARSKACSRRARSLSRKRLRR